MPEYKLTLVVEGNGRLVKEKLIAELLVLCLKRIQEWVELHYVDIGGTNASDQRL